MTIGTIINPLKKEVEELSSYKELLTLNEARLKKVMGIDADWLITTEDSSITPTPTPSKPSDSTSPNIPDSQVYQSLQAENEWAWETIDLLNKG